MLSYGDQQAPNVISFQCHPEFTKKYMSDLIKLRLGKVIPEPKGMEALRLTESKLISSEITALSIQVLTRNSQM